MQFAHDFLFYCSNYEAGKFSMVEHSHLAKIHENHESSPFNILSYTVITTYINNHFRQLLVVIIAFDVACF